MLTVDQFEKYLENNIGLDRRKVVYYTNQYIRFNYPLLKALNEYIETNEPVNFKYKEFDIEYIMKKIGCNRFFAFFYMQKIIEDENFRNKFKYLSFEVK